MKPLVMHAIWLLLILTPWGSAQETPKYVLPGADQAAASSNSVSTVECPAPPTAPPCVQVDVLLGCVVFDEQGELRVGREGTEPEVNRAGTIGASLAAKLNGERGTLPPSVSPATAGANFLLTGLSGTDSLQTLSRLQLRMAADGTRARAQLGNRKPRVVGVAIVDKGRTNQVDLENVGTLLEGTARMTDSGKVLLEISIERSDLGPDEEGIPIAEIDGVQIRSPSVETMTIETQVVVADGETIVLGGLVTSSNEQVKETFVLLTVTLIQP